MCCHAVYTVVGRNGSRYLCNHYTAKLTMQAFLSHALKTGEGQDILYYMRLCYAVYKIVLDCYTLRSFLKALQALKEDNWWEKEDFLGKTSLLIVWFSSLDQSLFQESSGSQSGYSRLEAVCDQCKSHLSSRWSCHRVTPNLNQNFWACTILLVTLWQGYIRCRIQLQVHFWMLLYMWTGELFNQFLYRLYNIT